MVAMAENYPGKTTNMLTDLAKELRVYIIGESIPQKTKDKIYNTSFAFNKEGELIGNHLKITCLILWMVSVIVVLNIF